MSVVEQTLREDPGGSLRQNEFCHARPLSPRGGEDGEEQPRCRNGTWHAMRSQLAQQGAARSGHDDREAHVGFYLIDKGLPQLERAADVRLLHIRDASPNERPASLAARISVRSSLMTAVFTGGLLAVAYAEGAEGWVLALTGLLSLVCTSQLAVALVNWLATVAGDAACAAANGLFRRDSPGIAHPGRRPDDAHQR